MKSKFIVDYTGRGSLIEGRPVYIRIKHSCGHLGILNIYAPNSAAERQEFWLQLVAKKPDADLWIIEGDFNMVEHPKDRRGNANGTVHGVEKYAWDKFCLAYNVIDCWNASNFQMQKEKSLLYSRVGGSVHGRTMARLDRWYLDPRLMDRKGRCIICPGTMFSNHAPVLLHIQENNRCKPHNVKVSKELVMDTKWIDDILKIWSNIKWRYLDPAHRLAGKIEECACFFRKKATEIRKEMKEKLQRM